MTITKQEKQSFIESLQRRLDAAKVVSKDPLFRTDKTHYEGIIYAWEDIMPDLRRLLEIDEQSKPNDPIFIMLVGIPGSGKSTLAKNLIRTTGFNPVYICPDEIRGELNPNRDQSDQSNNYKIFSKIVPDRIMNAAINKKNVVYDATNYSIKNRKPIIKLAKNCGYEVVAYIMQTPIDVAKARNVARDRKVPEWVIDKQFAGWEEPSHDEGFDKIIEVGF